MAKIIGKPLKNIPWQDREVSSNDPVWRYENNPIIRRNQTSNSNSIFNSAVVPFNNGFAGVFRCDSKSISMDIFIGFSEDGINWDIEDMPISFIGVDDAITKREYRYDPRICFIEDRYYITWCNGYHGPTIGLAYTFDFKTFHQMENIFLPYNRNGVLFPKKINGNYNVLSRPSDTGHTAFGDIFLSESPDLIYWGKHRFVMGIEEGDKSAWQSTKIGPGPVPIELDEGWLLIYHGVINTCNGFVYRMGGAILDKEDPSKVLYRSKNYLLAPYELYECVGDVPNVVFPCAALADSESGKIAIYYGCADTVTGLAFTTVDIIVDYIKKNAM